MALLTNPPLVAQEYSQNPFPNEMLSGYNSQKEQFNLPNPSFNFKGSGQINQPVILRGDGWIDNPYGDDDNNLKMPISDGVWIMALVLAAYTAVVYHRRRKERN